MKENLKTLAVLLNTNQLGGAERSVIEQFAGHATSVHCTFFIPDIGGDESTIRIFLKAKGFGNIVHMPFPGLLYQFSRSDWYKLILIPLLIPYLMIVLLKWNTLFRNFKSFYINGSKASFPVFFWLTFFRRPVRLHWHFRDYPAPNFFRVINKCISVARLNRGVIDFKIIANSLSVAESLKKIFRNYPIECVYNLAGQLPLKQSSNSVKTIGVVSMIAPWKGIHNVLLMAGIYGEELHQLGIERICFYGENIYHTNGPHKHYASELQALIKKLGIKNIEWMGLRNPQQIFSEIDLLIHSSVEPEPFGRVILEAFASGVPVISTGLGGAAELVKDNRALVYSANHPKDLIRKVKQVVQESSLSARRDNIAYQYSQNLEIQTNVQLSKIIREI